MATIKKVSEAGHGRGRGADNSYQPAQWGVFDGDTQVAVIYGGSHRIMERTTYVIHEWPSLRRVQTGMGSFHTVKEAKDWATSNL